MIEVFLFCLGISLMISNETEKSEKLVCQECRGAGSYVEPCLDYGEGPSYNCGWCGGTGYVSPYLRGLWLRYKRKEKKVIHDKANST